MDGLESFFNFKDGIKHILTNSKVAYLQNGEQIRYFKEYHCKVVQIKHIFLINFDYISKLMFLDNISMEKSYTLHVSIHVYEEEFCPHTVCCKCFDENDRIWN